MRRRRPASRQDGAAPDQLLQEQLRGLVDRGDVANLDLERHVSLFESRATRAFQSPQIGGGQLPPNGHTATAITDPNPDTGHCRSYCKFEA